MLKHDWNLGTDFRCNLCPLTAFTKAERSRGVWLEGCGKEYQRVDMCIQHDLNKKGQAELPMIVMIRD